MRRAIGGLFGVALAVALSAGTGLAQGRPLSGFGRQDLTFGPLIPGIATTVSRLDAANAGQFELRGTRFAEVQLELTLPAALVETGGASLPLLFSAGDGGYSTDPDIASAQSFDPRVPLITTLSNNGRCYIFLGGTAVPGGQQRAGTYSATITVTFSYTGV
ncbi:MAG TPA: hypothetical protein VGA37_01550 [Gemmatimonadales bacterium]